jgi:serine/threonine protein kinase
MIGKTLAHYEISGRLGKGGMGEVYQAKDKKLGRDVAIKVLPEEFARDADRVGRFQREAKLLASLNHPNIAAIHGLEESDGTNFLVLELVEGETLSDKLKRGPIPVEESLKLALQISEALDAAHEKGIIHRDLKPANIKVTPDGKVKVLDFGLAKAYAGDKEDVNLSNSPTLSEAATQQGIILGTAAYMSPEQARGEAVDKKADIWAFGVVLFEMLTGRVMFEGRTVSDTLAAVLMREPEWKRLPANLNPRLRLLLEHCLEKEGKNRCSSIGEARLDIQKVLADPGGILVQPVTTAGPRMKLRTIIPWIAAAIVLTAIIAGVVVWKLKPSEPRRVMRFTYELPEEQGDLGVGLAVSPDGSRFAYVTSKGLYLRSVDALDARLISGTDQNSTQPFFSPDGQWIAYWSSNERKIKKIAISGGAPIVLCDTNLIVVGLSWSPDNTIVYSDVLGGGVKRIPADGGTPEFLIKAEPANVKERGIPVDPQMLPDGKTLLFTRGFDPQNMTNMQVVIQSLESGKQKVLSQGFGGMYLPTGHLLYGLQSNNATNIVAVPFDLGKLEMKGGPVPMLEGIRSIALSNSGTLVYVSQPVTAISKSETTAAGTTASRRTLVWVDRKGREETLAVPPNMYRFPNISPDGKKVAMNVVTGENSDIWVWDLLRKTLTRLTFEGTSHVNPVWTSDGKRIAFFL